MDTRKTQLPAALWFLGSATSILVVAVLLATPVALGLLLLHLFSAEADHPVSWALAAGLIAATTLFVILSKLAAYLAQQRRAMETQVRTISEINQQIVGSISQNVGRIEMATSSMLKTTNMAGHSGGTGHLHARPAARHYA